MTNAPTVAVCIPTYNQADYLPLSILSALNQTYPQVEVWISDDASTDHTESVLAEFCRHHDRVHYYRQPQNLGIAANNTWLLQQPQTDYIVRLDSDDLLKTDYVKTLVGLLEQHPDAGYAHSAVEEIDEHGQKRGERRVYRKTLFQDADTALRASVASYRVAANICMFRSHALRELNYYKNRPDYTEDYDLSVRMADAGYGNIYYPEMLSSYRVWTDNNGVRPRRKGLEISGLTRIFDESLTPAFQRRKWDLTPVVKSRRRLATIHAASCFSTHFSSSEQAELVQLLKALGDSPRLRLQLFAIQLGLGPIFTAWHRFDLAVKGHIKAWLKPGISEAQEEQLSTL